MLVSLPAMAFYLHLHMYVAFGIFIKLRLSTGLGLLAFHLVGFCCHSEAESSSLRCVEAVFLFSRFNKSTHPHDLLFRGSGVELAAVGEGAEGEAEPQGPGSPRPPHEALGSMAALLCNTPCDPQDAQLLRNSLFRVMQPSPFFVLGPIF